MFSLWAGSSRPATKKTTFAARGRDDQIVWMADGRTVSALTHRWRWAVRGQKRCRSDSERRALASRETSSARAGGSAAPPTALAAHV